MADERDSPAVDAGWSTVPPAPAENALQRPVTSRRANGTLLGVAPPGSHRADGTLLGVAPPQAADLAAPMPRSPVVVHAGDAGAPTEPSESLPIPVAPQTRPLPALAKAVAAPANPVEVGRPPEPPPSSATLDAERAPALALAPLVAPAHATSSAQTGPIAGTSTGSKPATGVRLPLWSFLVLLMVAVAAVAVAGTRRFAEVRTAPAAAPGVVQPAAPPESEPAAPDVTALETRPRDSLNAGELLLLESAAAGRERDAAKLFREKLAQDPLAIRDKAVLTQLHKLASDPLGAPDALAIAATLPGPISADLLYEIWTETSNRTRTTDLARSLLHARDVRAKASDALAVALELRLAETCPESRELLPRALQVGDRRSLQPLLKLTRKQGCGATKRQDCYACLRDGGELDAAITAVKARRAPTPFGAP